MVGGWGEVLFGSVVLRMFDELSEWFGVGRCQRF